MAATSAPLQLFPSTNVPLPPPPRKSSLKARPQPAAVSAAPGQLHGLALQFTTSPTSPPRVQPATDTFKHSLFCEPPTSPGFIERASPSVPQRRYARRLSSRPTSLASKTEVAASPEDDELPPLPINSQFGSSPRLNRSPLKALRRSSIDQDTQPPASTPPSELFVDDDRLSPLPEKTSFLLNSPKSSEFSAALSQYSTPLAPSRSSSIRKGSSVSTSVAMSSIFPQYDHDRPFDQQSYYPTERAQAQTLPSEKISKIGSPTERPALRRFDSAVALVDGYEHIPCATEGDLIEIWNASNDHFPVAGRKVQLGLYAGRSTSLQIGTTGAPLYSMAKSVPRESPEKDKHERQFTVEKFDNQRSGGPVTVLQLSLPKPQDSESKAAPENMTIFPQAAAVHAIEIVASSPAAAEIATFDPTAASPAAARLAQDAVAQAHQRHGCDLWRTTRKRDSLGAVTAQYSLEHPTLGTMAITVTKSFKTAANREPRAKISIHHPSATPAAVAADTLVLAFLDFARDVCILDLPALLALDSAYIVDTVISALFAVAAIENSVLNTEGLTFAPPPKSPFVSDKAGKKSLAKAKKSNRWSRRSSRAIDNMQKELVGQPADVSPPVQGAVALVGLSLKAAIYVLEAGVRVGVKVVNHIVSKA